MNHTGKLLCRLLATGIAASGVAMEYHVPEIDGANWTQAKTWETIPRVEAFSREGSSDYFLLYPSECQLARTDDALLVRLTAYDSYPDEMVMNTAYPTWKLDDAAELYLRGSDGVLHQLLFNAAGAWIYFRDLRLGGDLPKGIAIHGERNAAGWIVTLRLSLSAWQLNWDDELDCKVRRNIPREFLVSCSEWGADADGMPAVRLRPEKGIFPREECDAYEQVLNADYRKFLTSFPSDAGMRKKLALLITPWHDPFAELNRQAQAQSIATCADGKAWLKRYAAAVRDTLKGNPERVASVDFSRRIGTVKMLNGTNLGPMLSGQEGRNFNELFRALRMSYARLHDAPLCNPGMRLVDTSLIFHSPDADPALASNYYFVQTDDYIANCREQGTDIIYRLGPSIEHSLKKYFAVAPADYNHFAEICAGIVRHYNNGWANGFHYGIRYWEIWNEPDLGPKMWDKTIEDYFRLYVVVAKRLKLEFPDIRIGGPALASLNGTMLRRFLEYCRQENAPVDFITWHRYGADPDAFVNDARLAALVAADSGYPEAELHCNEWHYFPCGWDEVWGQSSSARKVQESQDGLHGIDSAAFNTTLLSRWQDTPLTMSNFYMTNGSWGFLDPYGTLRTTYDGFLAFAPFADCRNRVAAAAGPADLALLAGMDDAGNGLVLISCFKMAAPEVCVILEGIPPSARLEVYGVGSAHGLTPVPFEFDGRELRIHKEPGSAIFQVRLTGVARRDSTSKNTAAEEGSTRH